MTDEQPDAAGDPGRRPFRPPGGGRREPEEISRPDLPDEEEPRLPQGVMSEIRDATAGGAGDVALALSLGAAAIDEERPDIAREYLPWARQEAPRSASIREALGIALYLDGEYRDALAELRAYRRLSGRQDQNHVIADCLRALERPVAEVADDVDAMLEDEDVPADRRLEGILVLAGRIADGGDLSGARAVLRRADDVVHELDRSGISGGDSDRSGSGDSGLPDALLRLWYVEGDLAQRDGDRDTARRYFRELVESGEDAFDARQRLEALTDG